MLKLLPSILLLSVGFSRALAAYDVVVYGATAGGVMTAVAAARQGAKVVLLEPRNQVGGMVAGGLSDNTSMPSWHGSTRSFRF